MSINVWLDRSEQLKAGTEIYRSHRKFTWWDYTSAHSRLLLRCDGGTDWTRIDVLFKSVYVMKVRSNYNGLHIRCATTAEQELIQRDTPGITYLDPACSEFDLGSRYFILDDGSGELDYVVAQAIGWHEDHARGEPSYFAQHFDTPPWAQTALDGPNGGFDTPIATVSEFVDTIVMPEHSMPAERTRYRFIYVVMGPEPHAYGAFLTRDEAERNRQQLAHRYPAGRFTIDATPVRI